MIKVTFNCAKHHVPSIEECLSICKPFSVVITATDQEEIFEPDLHAHQLWENCTLTMLFDDSVSLDLIKNECQLIADDNNIIFDISAESDQEWSENWRQEFQTMHFGKRLIIHPSHDTPDNITPYAILLDPGLAFGTGKHPTTSLCMRWLDSTLQGGESVLDYGCGSGILAIAAHKLGAHPVFATDIDQDALISTQDNCNKNDIDNIYITLPQELPAVAFDVVVANILANPLIELAAELATRVRPGGQLALSGILQHQADDVLLAYAPYFDIKQVHAEEEWVILIGTRTH